MPGNNGEPVLADHVERGGAEEYEVDHQGYLPDEPRQLSHGHTGLPPSYENLPSKSGKPSQTKSAVLGKVDIRYMPPPPLPQGPDSRLKFTDF